MMFFIIDALVALRGGMEKQIAKEELEPISIICYQIELPAEWMRAKSRVLLLLLHGGDFAHRGNGGIDMFLGIEWADTNANCSVYRVGADSDMYERSAL